MISIGEGYKPLGDFKKNLKNLSKSGGIYTPNEDYEDYIARRYKNVKELTIEELEELLK